MLAPAGELATENVLDQGQALRQLPPNGEDGAAGLSFEIAGNDLEISFLLGGMISVRFALAGLFDVSRQRFLELMQRSNGITFVWTKERWERDYLVFVVRERYARMYAFSPGRFEAACRLTPDGLEQLVAWLTGFWSGDSGAGPQELKPEDHPSGTFSW